ncbi:lysis protein [Salmonella enterica]|nr:lysis protein [Salmonella enterica]
MNRITTGVIVSLLILAAALGWTTSHYHGNAVKYKDQRDTVTHNLKMANETISDMQTRQRDVAALDAKYTKELADAQNRNTDLQRRLAAGSRVRVEGSCTVPTTTTTKPPVPAAWAMLPPSNSLQLLDKTFSISAPESSAIRKN